MEKRKIKTVILAAGESTRMKSDKSKVIHKILGKEIINYTVDAVIEAGVLEEDIIIVAGKNRAVMEKVVKKGINFVTQAERLGTAHALLAAYEYLENEICDTLVLVGDNPYITTNEINKLIDYHGNKDSIATLLTAVFPDIPPAYGRIIRDEDDKIIEIIEEIDASEEQKKIREVNASIYLFKNEIVLELLKLIDNKNKKGEYYLTDIIGILNNKNFEINGVIADDYRVSIGINNRWELQEAVKFFNLKGMEELSLNEGVTFLDPSSITIEADVKIGRDTIVYPSTFIARGTIIGKNCKIGPFAYIKKGNIQSNSVIEFTKINDEN